MQVVIDGVEYLPKNEIKEADLLILVEQLKKDAARYQQLRDNSAQQDISIQYHPFGDDPEWLYGENADIALDKLIYKRNARFF